MALSTSNYYSNSIVGTPGAGADIDIYRSDTSPKYQVGFGFQRGDGNRYRYCHFGTLTTQGMVVAADVSEGQLTVGAGAMIGAPVADLVKAPGENMLPGAAGSRYFQINSTATANYYAGGYLLVSSGTGYGVTYRIRGNTATGNPTSGDCYINLCDPIVTAITSNSHVAIGICPYANLEAATWGTDANIVGASVVANSASSYGWICEHGVTNALQGVLVDSGSKVCRLSTNTAGAVEAAPLWASNSSEAVQVVGRYINCGTATHQSLIFIDLG